MSNLQSAKSVTMGSEVETAGAGAKPVLQFIVVAFRAIQILLNGEIGVARETLGSREEQPAMFGRFFEHRFDKLQPEGQRSLNEFEILIALIGRSTLSERIADLVDREFTDGTAGRCNHSGAQEQVQDSHWTSEWFSEACCAVREPKG